MNVHEFELVQNGVVVVRVSQNDLVFVFRIGKVLVRSRHRARLVHIGRDAVAD
jgi:hypothetical protein